MTEDIVVPIAIFGSIAAMVIASFHFSFKKREAVFDAIKVAIEKTGTVEPALVDAIMRDNIGANADLRKGILFIAVAVALAMLGLMIPEEDVLGPMMGVASFPGLIGFSYVGFHFFAPREPTV